MNRSLSGYFLFLFIWVNSNLLFAQQSQINGSSDSNINISLSYGASFPIGTFSDYKSDKEIDRSYIIGGANVGQSFKIEGKYYFNKNIGIVINANMSSNKIEKIPYEVINGSLSSNGHGGSSSLYSTDYSSAKWVSNCFLAGLSCKLKSGTKDFSFKLLTGVQQLKSPQVKIDNLINYRTTDSSGSVIFGNYKATFFQSSLSTESLTLDLGVDLRLPLSGKLNFYVGLDYLFSNPVYVGNVVYTYDYEEPYPRHYEYEVPSDFYKSVSFAYLNFGLSYDL